jgi:hypothetical protein
MFCVNCGHSYDPAHQYCNFCGQPIITAPAAFLPTPNAGGTSAAAIVVPHQQGVFGGEVEPIPIPSAPPYARFALLVLSSEVMASIVAFNIANDSARGKWDSTLSTLVATVLCLLLLIQALKTWDELKAEITAVETSLHRRKLRSRSIVFGVLFITTGVIVGTAIGTSGAQTNQFIADSEHASQIATHISQARTSAANTVPAQIEMYKSIEADVQAWSLSLRQMRRELDIYDQKYPAQHESTANVIQSIEIGLKRADLLRQQIMIAKEIEPLDSSQQWSAWSARMQPLLNQEDALESAK